MRRPSINKVDARQLSYLKRLSMRNGDNEVIDLNELSLLAKGASAQAIAEAKALGLDITYLHDGVVYRESADGKRVVIKRIIPEIACSPVEIRKGTVLQIHVKKQD